jgi:hypothetical protein
MGGHPPLVRLALIAFAAQRDRHQHSPTDFQYPHFPLAVKSTSARLIQLHPPLLAGMSWCVPDIRWQGESLSNLRTCWTIRSLRW